MARDSGSRTVITQEDADKILSSMDRVNTGPFPDSEAVTNHAIARKVSDVVSTSGSVDFTNPDSPQITEDTMLAEGSIGKVRYAGLAYMLQQEGIIDLKQEARTFFGQDHVKAFLDRKYPGQNMQAEISKLFSGGNEEATLADITSHFSGVGDLTRDQAQLFKQKGGITRDYNLPVLLKIPEACVVIPRDDNDKPRAQSSPKTADVDLPKAELGMHQYSNLGYVLLSVVMEAAYSQATGKDKSYQRLVHDFMLHPTEGRAKGKLAFFDTKYASEVSPEFDDVSQAHWVDSSGKKVNANDFTGAHAAGSLLTSVSDSSAFFTEFFTGFPGTPEYGTEDVNDFFTKETIDAMQQEWQRHPATNQKEMNGDPNLNPRYQGPGFVVTVDRKTGEPTCYDKGGETFGYVSKMEFFPKTSTVDVSMVAQENLSGVVAKKTKVKLKDLISAYKDDKGVYDRVQMLSDFKRGKGVELIQKKVEESKIRRKAEKMQSGFKSRSASPAPLPLPGVPGGKNEVGRF